MKRLLINGKLAVIEADQYFPFTYKISDLEDINIVNFPSTKSFMLPRNTQNDDLFGHIAEITRLNFGYENNLSGVSFNQFKKATYELQYGSKTISEGILRIVNITNDNYEVELYDIAIEILEELEDKQLNELRIINPQTSRHLSLRVNHTTIKEMIQGDYGVVPIFCNYDSNHVTNQIYASKEGTYGNERAILELPSELTPLQLKTFPAGDMPYAMKINNVMDMIEEKHNVVFTPETRVYTRYVHMLLNKPKNPLITEQILAGEGSYFDNAGGSEFDGIKGYLHNMPITHKDSSSLIPFYNGNYMIKNAFNITFKTTVPRSSGIWTQYKSTNWNNNSPDGSTVGTLTLVSTPYLKVGGVETKLQETKTLIVMIKNVNTTFKSVGVNEELNVAGTFILNTNLFPRHTNGGTLRIEHRIYNTLAKTGTTPYVTYPFNIKSGYSFKWYITPTLVLKPLDFTEYDLLNSEKLLPKMSIKDFVLDVARTFNFSIEAKDSKLVVDIKKYQITDDVIALDDELDIDVSKVNFSRLKITSGVTDSDILKEYEEVNGEYGAQIINTGYTIKKEDKDVELPYSVPLALIDYDYFAYDQFGAYLNGGYNRFPTGDIRGLDDGLILGYIQTNKDDIYITDTEISEVTEYKPMLSNSKLVYDATKELRWTFIDGDTGTNLTMVDRYPTFMPYRIVDGVVVESLEVNKPKFNFGGLTDDEYPADTTLYHRYHKNMLQDKYSANTHVLTGKMFIDNIHITDKIYNYRNSNYIISELMEYDPTEPNMYEVKLMRVNDTDNYTVAPSIPPLTPIKYVFYITYSANSYFEGDLRVYGDNLGGHDTKLLLSTNDGPFEPIQEVADIRATHEFKDGETRVRSSRDYSRMFDDNNTYKIKVESKMRYNTDSPSNSNHMILPDSGVYTINPNEFKIGTLMSDNTARTLTIFSNPISYKYIEEPIKIGDFRKTNVRMNSNGYTISTRFVLESGEGSNDLSGATITVNGLNVSGVDINSMVDDVNYSYSDTISGREVSMTFQAYAQNPDPNIRLEDFEVGITGLSIQLYNPTVWVTGSFDTEVRAVASPMEFLSRILENITGNDNNSGGGDGLAKHKRSRVTYTIITYIQ